MFTFFANLRIQSKDRLERLRTCLELISRVKSGGWVFNIRGELKSQAADLIREMGLQPLTITHLEGEEGWSADTLQLLKAIQSEFTVFVVEDHFLVCNPLVLENSIAEMHQFSVDILDYSWHWPTKPYDCIKGIPHFEGNYITGFDLNLGSNITRHQNYEAALGYKGSVYSISMISIFRTSLLVRVCQHYQFERRRFGHMTPFDTERSGCDIDLFPLRTAYSKTELYAALDDENIIPGSSLHHRGMFRNLASRNEVQVKDGEHPWLYHDQIFLAPKELTQRAEVTVFFRTYKYVLRHLDITHNLSMLVGSYLLVMAEALRIAPGTKALMDYESMSGLMSVLFLKAFDGEKCTYRSHEDLQAVRAHENIFLNRQFSSYSLEYLTQRTTAGSHIKRGAFRTYADYKAFDPPQETAEPTTQLAFIDLQTTGQNELLEFFLDDLANTEFQVVILYTDLTSEKSPTTLLDSVNSRVIGHGFRPHANHDIELELSKTDDLNTSRARRFSIYRRI